MIRVLHGGDEYAIDRRLDELRASIGPQETRAANTSVFEGDAYSKQEMLGAAAAAPFLAEKRLVIVKGLLTRLEAAKDRRRGARKPRLPRGDWTTLPDDLCRVPLTTEVVFVDGALRRGGPGLRAANPAEKPAAEVESFPVMKGAALEDWIRRRFEAEGASVLPAAAARLADLVGGDTRLLAQEISKLALYAGGRAVARSDIELMVARAAGENIFAAIDAILERRPARATLLTYRLLVDGTSVQAILALLARQVRNILLAQHLARAGTANEDIAKRTGVRAGYPLRKTLEQARRFSLEYLAEVHRRLLATDVAIKTGQVDERLGIEMLVAGLSGV